MDTNMTSQESLYKYYQDLWKYDRWEFTRVLVKLHLRNQVEVLSHFEQQVLDTLTWILEDKEGHWLEGYNWYEEGLKRRMREENHSNDEDVFFFFKDVKELN